MSRVVLVVAGLVLMGCSSSGGNAAPSTTTAVVEAAESTTTTEAATSTTEPETTTTLSAEAIAEAEIEALVEDWYERPYDTSGGLEDYDLGGMIDPIRQRSIDFYDTLAAKGQYIRSSGESRVDVLAIDIAGESANVTVCTLGIDEIVDAETQEVLIRDDGTSWIGRVEVVVRGGEWVVRELSLIHI